MKNAFAIRFAIPTLFLLAFTGCRTAPATGGAPAESADDDAAAHATTADGDAAGVGDSAAPLPDPAADLFQELDRLLLQWMNAHAGILGGGTGTLHATLERSLEKRLRSNRPEVEAAIASPNPRRRAIAVAALGFSRDAEGTGRLLVPILGDADPDVVANALLGLWLSDAEPPVDAATTLLGSVDASVRANAALVLTRTRPGNVPKATATALEFAVADEDARVRLHAVRALGNARDRDALVPLLRALEDSEPLVRTAACLGLAKLGESDAAPALAKLLDSEESIVRDAAARAMAELSRSDRGR